MNWFLAAAGFIFVAISAVPSQGMVFFFDNHEKSGLSGPK